MAKMRHQSQRHDLDLLLEQAGLRAPFVRPSISHADLDIEVEINGGFFDVECKWTDEGMSAGEAYTNNARVAAGRDVYVVRFERGEQIREEVVPVFEERLVSIQRWGGSIEAATINDYHRLTRAWAQRQLRGRRAA